MTGLWLTWMRVWCWATLAFGVVLALGAFPATEAATRLFYDAIHWPLDGQSSFAETVRLTVGVLGAVMIGWALTILTIVGVARETALAQSGALWRGLTLAILVWYTVDSAISVALGAPMNAVSNSVFLATYLIPVFASGVLRGRAAPA